MNMRRIIKTRIFSLALALIFALVLCPVRTQAAVKASYSAQTLIFNEKSVSLDTYNIGGYNYFRLRDVAALMKDTIYRFSLETDSASRLVRAKRFGPCADTLTPGGRDLSKTAQESAWKLSVDGKNVPCAVYNIGGSNFYRLRDLASAFGFAVGYDQDRKAVLVAAEPLSGTEEQEEACFAALEALYTARDFEKGASLLADAAKLGSARALFELGEGYYAGLYGIKQDDAKAAEYARASAEGGNARGMYLYALLLYKGQGVKTDKSAALSWFEKAADAGNVQAQSFLGAQYYAGEAVEQSYSRAWAYAKPAADFGDARACYTAGRCLYFGYGTMQNAKRAVSCFLTAADGGILEALHALGVCYYHGKGVDFNPYIAFHYFSLAADAGYAPSAYNAGVMCAQGVGTEKDMEKAKAYMRAAADGGVKEAEAWLGEYK